MTKCPPFCKLRTSFFYKVLTALKQLQSSRKHCNGACLEDIAKFMEANYCLHGDIQSQVENSLCIAEQSRFLLKKKNIYSLITPAATIHVIPSLCVKAKLEEIENIFNQNSCVPNKCPRKKKNIPCIPCANNASKKCNLPVVSKSPKKKKINKKRKKSIDGAACKSIPSKKVDPCKIEQESSACDEQESSDSDESFDDC